MKFFIEPRKHGFSLVELMVAVAIIALLAGLAISAFNSVVISMNLNRTGQMVGDQIALARQEAVSRNTDVEVRFVAGNDDTSKYTSFQTWRLDAAGENAKPITKFEEFPLPIVINGELSPLLTKSNRSGTANFSSLRNQSYKAVCFRPNGRLDTSLGLDEAYLTIQTRNANVSSPDNYFTIQINPLTGRVSYYRP